MSTPNVMLLIATLFASGAALLILALLVFREFRRVHSFDGRLMVMRRHLATVAPRHRHGDGPGHIGFSVRTVGLGLLRAGSMLVPVGASEREKLTGMLRRAGFAKQDALSLFLSAKLLGAIALAVPAGLFAARLDTLGLPGFLVAIAAMVGLVVGSIAPEYVLRTMMARRLRKMNAALPDALDLMVMCLASGLTFERALATVAEQLSPIERSIADEFRQIEAELRLASNRRVVLQEYYRRTEIDGLRDIAMTLIQSDRYGTPLTQSLKNIATGERVQRAARVAAQAERLPVLMTMPMLFFVVPGTMLLVAGPAILTAIKALTSLGGG